MGLDDTIAFIDREILIDLGVDKDGFHHVPEEMAYNVIENKVKWATRRDLEKDPTKKQIIPYAAVLKKSNLSFVLTYRRKTAGNEARLHDQVSIGFGGHINEDMRKDRAGIPVPLCGLRSELEEELLIDGYSGAEYLGLINWDADEVGRVHLGVAYRVRVQDATIREKDKLKGWWARLVTGPGVSSGGEIHEMEDWSRLLCADLVRWLEGHATHTLYTEG